MKICATIAQPDGSSGNQVKICATIAQPDGSSGNQVKISVTIRQSDDWWNPRAVLRYLQKKRHRTGVETKRKSELLTIEEPYVNRKSQVKTELLAIAQPDGSSGNQVKISCTYDSTIRWQHSNENLSYDSTTRCQYYHQL